MKNHRVKTIALTLACATALATHAPARDSFFDNTPAPAKTQQIATRTKVPNFSIDAGASFMTDRKNSDYWGGNLSLAWQINENNKLQFKDEYYKIQIDLGCLRKSRSENVLYYYNNVVWRPDNHTIKTTIMPVLLSLTLCVPLDHDGRWEWRFSPTIGAMIYKKSARIFDSFENPRNRSAFAYGLGTGIAWHMNSSYYIEAKYRLLGANVSPLIMGQSPLYTHTLTCALGWKF
jgi:hypothetical protein